MCDREKERPVLQTSTLFASCMRISGDLYPPTSSRVIFAWREHSEVTPAKNNPARAGGGVGGSWR